MKALFRRRILTNPLSMVAGALALVSVFSPWWGFASPYGTFYFGLYPTPYDSRLGVSQMTQILMQYNPVILGLVLLSGLLAILGSFTTTIKYQLAGFTSSLLTLIIYPVVLMYSLGASCQGQAWCVGAPTGSNGYLTWGFQIGYYLILATTILYPTSVLFHGTFLSSELPALGLTTGTHSRTVSSEVNPVATTLSRSTVTKATQISKN